MQARRVGPFQGAQSNGTAAHPTPPPCLVLPLYRSAVRPAARAGGTMGGNGGAAGAPASGASGGAGWADAGGAALASG